MGSPSKSKSMTLVTESDLRSLMETCSKNVFSSNTTDPAMVSTFDEIQRICVELFDKDYTVKIIDNKSGSLSATYPSKIVFLAPPADDGQSTDRRAKELRQHMEKARVARARTRFVVPVILYDGKHICRSATLSGGMEIFGRTVTEFVYGASASLGTQLLDSVRKIAFPSDSGGSTATSSQEASQESSVSPDKSESSDATASSGHQQDESQPSVITQQSSEEDASLHGELRKVDIELLKALSVHNICDLMVEGKKEKCYVKVTSSEKVDKYNRYRDFTIFKLPYPGCEFFEPYARYGFKARNLRFDWSQNFVDVELQVPEIGCSSELGINWAKYKDWDLQTLTTNYLRLLLAAVVNGQSGLLVHCISGWDRTPLFISLLRLSMWADNEIHQNLSPLEMAYLTVAYDWFLFSHNLPNRIQKNEQIFYFCFDILKQIGNQAFSVATLKKPKVDIQSPKVPTRGVDTVETSASSCAGVPIPVITSCPPEAEATQMDTSGSSASSSFIQLGFSEDEVPCTTQFARKQPVIGASSSPVGADSSSDLEMSNGTHLTVESTAPTQASLSPANGSPSNHSERSWAMIECVESTDSASSPESAARQRSLSRQSCSSIEATDSGQDQKKRSIEFVLQRRTERLQEIRRLVRKFYLKT
ncbi:phosphatidylinositol-3,5-bisphosphate 3-phosphatase MTMR14-like isoform X2 [Dermacentor andersoni]|uniref:phosphatidylinositol-3,5-bisphosphate 3-phosphatase MTMR14-like isoform X2 n=1 Tax=Dermacentor andersoni TaxID=34620 RepID=UPI002416BC19|nr:myotubularin-related protein 14-like isoform X2 [Dermacentor andersoni]